MGIIHFREISSFMANSAWIQTGFRQFPECHPSPSLPLRNEQGQTVLEDVRRHQGILAFRRSRSPVRTNPVVAFRYSLRHCRVCLGPSYIQYNISKLILTWFFTICFVPIGRPHCLKSISSASQIGGERLLWCSLGLPTPTQFH